MTCIVYIHAILLLFPFCSFFYYNFTFIKSATWLENERKLFQSEIIKVNIKVTRKKVETCKLAKHRNTETRLGVKSKTKWRQRKVGKGEKAEERHKLCKRITNIVHIARVEFKFAAQPPCLSFSLCTPCKLHRLSVYTLLIRPVQRLLCVLPYCRDSE